MNFLHPQLIAPRDDHVKISEISLVLIKLEWWSSSSRYTIVVPKCDRQLQSVIYAATCNNGHFNNHDTVCKEALHNNYR